MEPGWLRGCRRNTERYKPPPGGLQVSWRENAETCVEAGYKASRGWAEVGSHSGSVVNRKELAESAK